MSSHLDTQHGHGAYVDDHLIKIVDDHISIIFSLNESVGSLSKALKIFEVIKKWQALDFDLW
jgi:hypothetical protein